MIKDVTLGQYFPGKSIIHKLDPRVKVLLTLVNIVFIFIAGNFSSLGLMTVFTLVAMLLSGVPFTRYIRSIRGVLFIVLFTSILNLFYGGGTVLVQWGFIQITTGGIRNAIFIAVRIVVLILMSSILTYTTSPTQLTDALERLMKPLKIFRGAGGGLPYAQPVCAAKKRACPFVRPCRPAPFQANSRFRAACACSAPQPPRNI